MDRILRRLETWGYPQRGIAWLRRRRLIVIVTLAILSWVLFVGLIYGGYFLALEVGDVVVDMLGRAPGSADATSR